MAIPTLLFGRCFPSSPVLGGSTSARLHLVTLGVRLLPLTAERFCRMAQRVGVAHSDCLIHASHDRPGRARLIGSGWPAWHDRPLYVAEHGGFCGTAPVP